MAPFRAPNHPEIVKRLRRAEGHPRSVIAMIEVERPPGARPADARGGEGDRSGKEGADRVVFHLLGALSQFGKLGLVAVAETPARAAALWRNGILD